MLVERERVTGTSRVSAVPVKGTSGQFAAMRCWISSRSVALQKQRSFKKTDPELAIEAWRTWSRQEEPLGEVAVGRGSNGVAERGVESVSGFFRTLFFSSQERLRARIKLEEQLVIFVAEYAAYLVNRLEVGKDEKTSNGHGH